MKYLITMVVSTDCRRAYKENLSPEWLQRDVGVLMNLNHADLHEVKVVPITEGQPDTVSESPSKTAVTKKIAEELGMPYKTEEEEDLKIIDEVIASLYDDYEQEQPYAQKVIGAWSRINDKLGR